MITDTRKLEILRNNKAIFERRALDPGYGSPQDRADAARAMRDCVNEIIWLEGQQPA